MRAPALALAAILAISPFAHPQNPPACSGDTVDTSNAAMAAPARAFVHRLAAAVAQNDRRLVASLVHYPLPVYTGPGKKTLIRNQTDLLAHYTTVFNPKARAALSSPDAARCLFYRDQGFMIGDGEIWFDGPSASTLKINSINIIP